MERVPAEIAAGVNGQNCRATNFEESGPGRHIGPLCVHTALAVGQRAHVSGREVLAASLAGTRRGDDGEGVAEERLADPLSRRLAAAVEIIEDPESSRAYKEFRRSDIRGTAQIDAGSRTYQAACTMGETFGGPGMAMPEAMVEEKFLEATSLSLSLLGRAPCSMRCAGSKTCPTSRNLRGTSDPPRARDRAVV